MDCASALIDIVLRFNGPVPMLLVVNFIIELPQMAH